MGKENFHRIKKNMRKYKYLKIQAFLNILCKAEIHAIPKVLDAVNSYSTEKVCEKNKLFKIRYSWIFHVKQKSMQFPNRGMNEFLYYGTSMERHWQIVLYLTDLKLVGTQASPNICEFVLIPMTWKYSVKNHIILRLYVFEEIRTY